MNNLKEELKQEAIQRMKNINIRNEIIEEFIKDKVYITQLEEENTIPIDREQERIIKQYEEEKDILIYHVLNSKSKYTNSLYFLYVADNMNEWKQERKDNKCGFIQVLSYELTKREYIFGIKNRNKKLDISIFK